MCTGFENDSMQGVNALSLLGIDKQNFFDRRNGGLLYLVGTLRVGWFVHFLIHGRRLGDIVLVPKILGLSRLIGHLRIDGRIVPSFGTQRLVGLLPRIDGGFGDGVEMGQDNNAGPARTPLAHAGMSGCLAGPGVADFDYDIYRFQGFRELPFGLGNVPGVPLHDGAIVTVVHQRSVLGELL